MKSSYDYRKKNNNYITTLENGANNRRKINKRYRRRLSRRRRIRLAILKTIAACSFITLLGMMIAVILLIRTNLLSDNESLAEAQDTEIAQLENPEDELIAEVEEPQEEAQEETSKEPEETENQECFEAELFTVSSTPTSIKLEWADAELGNYYVLYRPVVEGTERHGKATREDGSASMSTICTCVFEANDSGDENESNGWIKRNATSNKLVLDGLDPNTTYHVHIIYADKSLGQYSDPFDVATANLGYCDPFKATYSVMRISERSEETGEVINRGSAYSVLMSSYTGCEGAVVKPMFDTDVFSRASRDQRKNLGTIAKGSKLIITPDEGNNYCYYDGNSYKIHIQSEDGKQYGWIEARAVLIDMNKVFTVNNAVSSMQFDRTNAYSSIFTAGGDAQNVETQLIPAQATEGVEADQTVAVSTVDVSAVVATEQADDEESERTRRASNPVDPAFYDADQDGVLSPEEYANTRYAPLMVNGDQASYMNTSGYNVIDNVTNLELSNYESKDYMPVIWDLAMELKQCQKNALENGYTIKMYEGYRPLSTSRLVYNSLNGSGVLAVLLNDTTLAQGYITGQTYNVGHYIGYNSRHNRGIATDLTIVRILSSTELGEEAHTQTKMHTLDYRCNMFYNTWEADLLTDIMTGHGSNLNYLGLRQEWWHFQLNTNRKDLYPYIESYGYEDLVF